MRARAVLVVMSLSAAGCGSDGTGRLPVDVAARLAGRAEQVAVALDTGTCDDALAKARSLQTDVAALPAEPAVRAEALARVARPTSGISCPVVTTAPPAGHRARPQPRPRPGRKGKGHKGDHDDD